MPANPQAGAAGPGECKHLAGHVDGDIAAEGLGLGHRDRPTPGGLRVGRPKPQPLKHLDGPADQLAASARVPGRCHLDRRVDQQGGLGLRPATHPVRFGGSRLLSPVAARSVIGPVAGWRPGVAPSTSGGQPSPAPAPLGFAFAAFG